MAIEYGQRIRSPSGHIVEQHVSMDAKDVIDMSRAGVGRLPEIPVARPNGSDSRALPDHSENLRAVEHKK